MKKVLVLGAGLVSKPMVDYLLNKDFFVRVATRTVSKAEALIKNHKNGEAVQWVVEQKDKLEEMVKDSDLVVSLLPYIYHVQVAEVCIKYKKHMVTTSYVSDKMQNLDKNAREAGIIILNEIGLDPGIDHMSSMEVIDNIKAAGGKIISFRSLCGSLPAPEASNNPFRYKFGWSPRGVALAGRNSARYIENGSLVEIPGRELFKHYYTTKVNTIGEMEVYPNRDSVPYLKKYAIPEAKTIFRGTLRYPGWCNLWYIISNLGLLETEEKDFTGMAYSDFMKSILKIKHNDIRGAIAAKFNLAKNSEVLDKLEWLGVFSEEPIRIGKGGNIDVLVDKLLEKLRYENGERDMVILKDEIEAEYGNKKFLHVSTLIDYGLIGKDTAIARTVSLPAACATKMILEGEITERGVHIPVLPDIYKPVLKELATLGIKSKEEKKEL